MCIVKEWYCPTSFWRFFFVRQLIGFSKRRWKRILLLELKRSVEKSGERWEESQGEPCLRVAKCTLDRDLRSRNRPGSSQYKPGRMWRTRPSINFKSRRQVYHKQWSRTTIFYYYFPGIEGSATRAVKVKNPSPHFTYYLVTLADERAWRMKRPILHPNSIKVKREKQNAA